MGFLLKFPVISQIATISVRKTEGDYNGKSKIYFYQNVHTSVNCFS